MKGGEGRRKEPPVKKIPLSILALLALAWPAWAGPEVTGAGGCHADRNGQRPCREAVLPAKARAKEKTLGTYKDMEQSKAKAKETTLDNYKAAKPAKAKAKEKTLDTYADMKKAKARTKAGAAREKAPARTRGEAEKVRTGPE
jgi:hypothetical protein